MIADPTASMASEIDATLARLSSNSSVLGILVLARKTGFILKAIGDHFEQDAGRSTLTNGSTDADGDTGSGRAGVSSERARTMAERVHRLVESAAKELDGLMSESDEPRFLRIRLKRHELMITPGASKDEGGLTHADERYILVVVHKPPE